MVFPSVAIYLDCAWSANGGRKEKIRKSQVGNQLLKLYFGSFCSAEHLSVTLLQSVFLTGREDDELGSSCDPLDLTQAQWLGQQETFTSLSWICF